MFSILVASCNMNDGSISTERVMTAWPMVRSLQARFWFQPYLLQFWLISFWHYLKCYIGENGNHFDIKSLKVLVYPDPHLFAPRIIPQLLIVFSTCCSTLFWFQCLGGWESTKKVEDAFSILWGCLDLRGFSNSVAVWFLWSLNVMTWSIEQYPACQNGTAPSLH